MSSKNRNLLVIVIILLIFLGLVIAGISSEEPTNNKQMKEPTNSKQSLDLKQNFIDGCTGEGANIEYCECSWNELRKIYSEKEIAEKGLEYKRTGELPDGFGEAVTNCTDKLEF